MLRSHRYFLQRANSRPLQPFHCRARHKGKIVWCFGQPHMFKYNSKSTITFRILLPDDSIKRAKRNNFIINEMSFSSQSAANAANCSIVEVSSWVDATGFKATGCITVKANTRGKRYKYKWSGYGNCWRDRHKMRQNKFRQSRCESKECRKNQYKRRRGWVRALHKCEEQQGMRNWLKHKFVN